MKIKKKISLIITLLIIFSINAQKVNYLGHPKIINYTKLDFNAYNQSWDFIQDKRGYLYNANTAGLVIFDGQEWIKIQLPKSAPALSLTKDNKGRIYVAGKKFIGYISADSIGNFKYQDIEKISQKNLSEIWRIKFIEPNYLAFFTSDSLYVYNIKNQTIKSFDRAGFFSLLTTINNKVAIFGRYNAAYLLPEEKEPIQKISLRKRLVSREKSYIISDFFQAFDDKIILLRLDSIFLLDKNFNILRKNKAPTRNFNYSHTTNNNYVILSYANEGIYLVNKNLEVVNFFDKKTGLISNTCYALYTDTYNNLWVSSDNGIDYIILNSPLSYLDQKFDFERARTAFHYKNKFYFLLAYNIKYIPDSILLNPLKSYKTLFTLSGGFGQSWDVEKINNNYYIAHNPDVLLLEKNQAKPLNLFNFNVWNIEQIPGTNKIFIGTSKGGYIANINENKIENVHKIIENNLRYFVFDKHKRLWAVIYNDTAFFARITFDSSYKKFNIEKIYSVKEGVNTPYELFPSYDKARDIIIISDNKTIKYWNKKQDKFVEYKDITKYFNEPNDELYLIYIDELNNYWVNYVNTTKSKPLKYRVYLFKFRNNRLVYSPFLSGSAIYQDYFLNGYTYKKRYVFLPSTKGFVIFDYMYKTDLRKFKYNIYLKRIISTKDNSTVWGGNTILSTGEISSTPPRDLKIPYKNNALAFYVAAPFFENSDALLFSYKLEGLDKNWSPWVTNNYREYSFLREGKYTIKIKSKNLYNIETPILSYSFEILPPWYRTTSSYIAYLVILIGLIIVSARLYTYSLRKRNERLEKIVRDRTREIEMKNIELEQQKEEIQTQAEELAEINQQLQKLSLIAEKTDNAVLLTDKKGEFIWVNSAFTKIFGYTLEELKTFVSPNIISNKTSEYIKKLIHKCFNEKITVEYEAKFKTKFGNTIWVHTTLTPVIDEEGNVVNLIVIDSDITKLKEAEEKIRIHNENIKGSIRYAQALLTSILPLKEEIERFFESFILFKPRDIVSGDFYWISPIYNNSSIKNICSTNHPKLQIGDYFFISVIDCTGHGVPGAIMSTLGNQLLNNIINQNKIHNPAHVLDKMDQDLAHIFKHTKENYRDGMSGVLCRFDLVCEENKPFFKITFSGAKANLLVYKNKTQKLTLVRGIRRIIGQKFLNKLNFQNQIFYLENNDIMFFFTDGYKDQNNHERNRIGMTKFQNLLLKNINKPMEEIKNHLDNFLKKWMQNTEQRDDITVIGIKIKNL